MYWSSLMVRGRLSGEESPTQQRLSSTNRTSSMRRSLKAYHGVDSTFNADQPTPYSPHIPSQVGILTCDDMMMISLYFSLSFPSPSPSLALSPSSLPSPSPPLSPSVSPSLTTSMIALSKAPLGEGIVPCT